MSEFLAMRKFLKFVASQMQQRELLLFSEKPEIFLDKTINLGKTINNTILGGDLLNWIHENRPQAHIEIGDIEALFGQRQSHRYDVIVANHSNDKGGLLANLINRCAIYSTFIFVFGVEKEKVEAIAPKTLEDLYAVVQTDEQFVCIEPKLFFVSKMVAYSYFNEVPYKRLFSCVISQEKLEKMVFCKKAADIAKNKMVVGLIKDNLDKLERTDGFVDKDLNFCVLGIPNRNIQWQQLSLDSQFDVGTIVDISHTSRMILDEEQVDKWGNSALLPKVLIPYLHELLKHSAKEILRILEIGNGEGIYSKEIYGGQYSLFSVTVGQYIPSQKGCCTFACYYLDRLDSSALRIKNTATALYAQLSSFILEDARNRFLAKSVQTAIGSIMSRNGSHNIGSHVLAALSHNVGTMPDDRVLYQYIQHRMDYTATVTTEPPIWSQSTMFVGEMMKRFFSQRHLLNFIAGSEGLSVYEFQNKNITVADQEGKIQIFIRRTDKGHECDFIKYDSGKEGREINLAEDLALAIPGGVIGQHAFFTIVENILRNAAKHNWARADGTIREELHNLELHIDFYDNRENNCVTFTIWVRGFDIKNGRKDFCVEAAVGEKLKKYREQYSGIKDDSERQSFLSKMPLHHKLMMRLEQPFINDQGQLRKENWGLAEMRISAGYLQGRSTAEIGGLEDTALVGKPIITPVAQKDEKSDKYYLGYQFDVKKPKEILIVVNKEDVIPEVSRELSQHGIYFKYINEGATLDKDTVFDYSFVVFDAFNPEKHADWPLPFRVLSGSDRWYKVRDNGNDNKYDAHRRVCKRLIPVFKEYGKFVDNACRLANDGAGVASYAHNLRMAVYKCWIGHIKDSAVNDHLFDDRRKSDATGNNDAPLSDLTLVLQVDGNDSGKHKGLVTENDLVKMVFENCLNTAIRSYLEVFGKGCTNAFIARLLILLQLPSRLIDNSIFHNASDISAKISMQIDVWLKTAMAKNLDVKEILKVLNEIPAIHNQIPRIKEEINAWKRACGNINETISIVSRLEEEKKAFARYLSNVIVGQAEVFLSKYEEKIASLPSGYEASRLEKGRDSGGRKAKNANGDKENREPFPVSICFKGNDSKPSSFNWHITYRRHEDFGACEKSYSDGECYLEPLSGSQSYLNAMIDMSNRAFESKAKKVSLGDSDWQMIVKLIESGLTNVWIIDERVKEFAKEHVEVGETFRHIGVTPSNEDDKEVAQLFDDFSNNASGDASARSRHQVLVIHQGIIDKCLQGDQSADRVAQFLKFLVEKKHIRYVVITTGRGKPANIPDIARVLPFSIIESTLFKKYPEKMLLVDAIMGMLPGRKENA